MKVVGWPAERSLPLITRRVSVKLEGTSPLLSLAVLVAEKRVGGDTAPRGRVEGARSQRRKQSARLAARPVMMCMDRPCVGTAAVSPLVAGPTTGPCLPAERGSPEELVRQWLASLPGASPRGAPARGTPPRGSPRGQGGSQPGTARDMWPGDQPAAESPRSDSESTVSTDYGNIWVPAHIFSQHARAMGLGPLGSKPPSTASPSPPGTGPAPTPPEASPTDPNAVPRVKSAQRQLYQNWSVLPPVQAPRGQPTPPEHPPPPAEGTTSPCKSARTPSPPEGGAQDAFAPLSVPPAGPRVRSPVARATLRFPGLTAGLRDWEALSTSTQGRGDQGSGGSGSTLTSLAAADQEGTDHICAYSRVTGVTSHWDLACLHTALHRLNISGFYFGKMTWEEARGKLRSSPVGTFLVRDSSDPRYLFSLSVKTSRGTTSIRLVYAKGGFRLDCCDPGLEGNMPRFDCVIALIRYYIDLSSGPNRNTWVFYESTGRKDTPVVLGRPYRQAALSLKDLARRALHQTPNGTGNGAQTTLPATARARHPEMTDFINQYPHPI